MKRLLLIVLVLTLSIIIAAPAMAEVSGYASFEKNPLNVDVYGYEFDVNTQNLELAMQYNFQKFNIGFKYADYQIDLAESDALIGVETDILELKVGYANNGFAADLGYGSNGIQYSFADISYDTGLLFNEWVGFKGKYRYATGDDYTGQELKIGAYSRNLFNRVNLEVNGTKYDNEYKNIDFGATKVDCSVNYLATENLTVSLGYNWYDNPFIASYDLDAKASGYDFKVKYSF